MHLLSPSHPFAPNNQRRSASRPRRWFAPLGFALGLTAAARADTPPPAAGTTPVVMSPFEVAVDQDKGYQAADTVSAGDMATTLLKTPADISVLTRQFLDDISVNKLSDAYMWLPNTMIADPSPNSTSTTDTGSNYTIRGLPTSGNARNYFGNINTSLNAYNTERVEQVRGPDTILYGTSLAGGLINIITKRAEFRDFADVTDREDTYGTRVDAIDVNEMVGSDVAVRLNVVDQQLHTWIKSYYDNLDAADLTVTARPWEGFEMRFDGEMSYRNTADAAAPEGNIADDYSAWNRTTVVTAPLTAQEPAATGISRQTTSNSIYVASPAFGGTMQNINNLAVTLGSGITLAPISRAGIANFPSLPDRNFSGNQPSNFDIGNHYFNFQGVIDKTLSSGLAMELSGQFTGIRRDGPFQPLFGDARIDVNAILANGSPNPEFLQPFSDSTLQDYGHEEQDNVGLRFVTLYPITTRWFTQTIALVAQSALSDYDRETKIYGRLNNGNPDTTGNIVDFREYWNDPSAPMIYPTTDGAGGVFGFFPGSGFQQRTLLDSLQLGSVGYYFDHRLTLMGGLRRDVYDFSQSTDVITNGVITGHTPNPYSTSRNTASGGFTFFPVSWIGVYGDYSEGFNPNSISNPFLPGQEYQPSETSKVQSGGLRLNLFQGVLVGSIGYYKLQENNRVTSVSQSNINQIWTVLDLAQDEPNGGVGSFSDTYNYKGHGWEADLTANISNHLRIIANVALPTTETFNSDPGARAYLAANLPTWNAAIAANVLPNLATLESNLLTFENTVAAGGNGRPLNNTYKWQANLFGEYLFDSGFLKGFRLGGGLNFFGDRLIGNYNGLPYDYIYQNAYTIASLTAGYSFKVGKLPVDLQANISNLFDYSQPIFYNVAYAAATASSTSGVAYKNSYNYVQPTTLSVSLTLHF